MEIFDHSYVFDVPNTRHKQTKTKRNFLHAYRQMHYVKCVGS